MFILNNPYFWNVKQHTTFDWHTLVNSCFVFRNVITSWYLRYPLGYCAEKILHQMMCAVLESVPPLRWNHFKPSLFQALSQWGRSEKAVTGRAGSGKKSRSSRTRFFDCPYWPRAWNRFFSSQAHKTGSWYLLSVLFKICDDHLRVMFIQEPPGMEVGGGGGGGGGGWLKKNKGY